MPVYPFTDQQALALGRALLATATITRTVDGEIVILDRLPTEEGGLTCAVVRLRERPGLPARFRHAACLMDLAPHSYVSGRSPREGLAQQFDAADPAFALGQLIAHNYPATLR